MSDSWGHPIVPRDWLPAIVVGAITIAATAIFVAILSGGWDERREREDAQIVDCIDRGHDPASCAEAFRQGEGDR